MSWLCNDLAGMSNEFSFNNSNLCPLYGHEVVTMYQIYDRDGCLLT